MQVVGRNKLQTIVKEFCTQAGFSGYYTNHSGKVQPVCLNTMLMNNSYSTRLDTEAMQYDATNAHRLTVIFFFLKL